MSDSDSSSDSESSEEQTQPVTKTNVQESSDSDDSSDDEEMSAPKAAPVKKEESSDDSSSDEEEEEEEAKPKKTDTKDVSSSSSEDDSDDEEEATEAKKPTQTEADEADSDDSSSDEAEEETKAEPAAAKAETKADAMEVEEEEPDFSPVKQKKLGTILFTWELGKDVTPRKRKLSTPTLPAAKKQAPKKTAPASSASVKIEKEFNPDDFRSAELKDQTDTIFVKGIDVNAYEKDIKEFFTERVAEPVSIRHKWEESRPGLAWVTFATNEQASKAVIDCNGEYIKDRYVFTDWAKPRQNSGGGRGRGSGPRNAHLKDTTNRVWVGNLHREVDQETLTELFKETGEPTDVYILAGDGSRPQIAFVSFDSNETASKVVENLQGSELMGNSIRLDWAEPRRDGGSGGGRGRRTQALSEKPEGCVTCFVGRLSDEVDDDKLQELFKEAGEIASIRYMERDGEFKGVAFVQFGETEATDKAVKLNGTSFLGKAIRVDYAADRKKEY